MTGTVVAEFFGQNEKFKPLIDRKYEKHVVKLFSLEKI